MYLKSFHTKFLLLGKPLPPSVLLPNHLSQGPSNSADHNLVSREMEKKKSFCLQVFLPYSSIFLCCVASFHSVIVALMVNIFKDMHKTFYFY